MKYYSNLQSRDAYQYQYASRQNSLRLQTKVMTACLVIAVIMSRRMFFTFTSILTTMTFTSMPLGMRF